MKLATHLNRPEYVFRPRQLYRRLANYQTLAGEFYQQIQLPWQVKLKTYISSDDIVGKAIASYGVYDLCLTETLWRLTQPKEIVLDIGANVGYTTSIMAARVGIKGKVICFEPNPSTYADLNQNINIWKQEKNWHHIESYKLAISNFKGSGKLVLPSKNRGEAFIEDNQDIEKRQSDCQNHNEYTVSLIRLDEMIQETSFIGVMKIDVEGHELEVLQGSEKLIANKCIRDIVFEEHKDHPNPVSQFLEKKGYTIFRIWKGFWRPILKAPGQKVNHPWEPPNYLATLEPERAIQIFQKPGWYSLYNREIRY